MKRVFGLSVALLAAAAVPALAQQAVPAQPSPQYVTPFGTYSLGQLYLRGDAGDAFSSGGNLHSADPFATDSLLGPGVKQPITTGNSPVFDVGLGSRLTPYLRWDATMSYLPSMKLNGSGDAAHMNSWVGLVNGYFDFGGLLPGMFGPFQPYVDAGVGGASNTIDTLYTGLGGGTAVSGNTRTSLAYGLGAGLGYPVAPNMTLDVAYRYLDLGDAETGTIDTAGAVTPLKTNLRENTVTLGMRYMF